MNEGQPTVVLISESRQESEQFQEAVSEKGWVLRVFQTWGPDCLGVCLDGRGVVVVDLVREDGAGLDILREVEAGLSGKVPTLVVASMADKLTLMQGLEHGVTDFLWRGASALEVQSRLTTALRLGSIQRELQSLVRVDKLTGTHSQAHIVEILEREFERSRRYKRPISCMLVDIDGFEELESLYEHTRTEQILRICSEAMTDTLRNVDEVSRFRKSIFLVLMPETSAGKSIVGLERVRTKIDQVQSEVLDALGMDAKDEASPYRLTLTAGIATYPDDGLNSHADLIMAAETALYEAKRKGAGETVRADFQ